MRKTAPTKPAVATRARRAGGPPRLDAANLAGITTLMNPQHVKAGVNLEEVEKSVMGKGRNTSGKKPDVDPVRLYTAELSRLAEELGIDLLDDGDAAPVPKVPPLTPETAVAPRSQAGQRGALAGASASVRANTRAGIRAGAPGPARTRVDDLIDDLDLDGDDGKKKSESGESGEDDEDDESSCDCDDDCADDCSCACHSESAAGSDESSCDCDDDCADDCSCACHSESGSADDESGDDERVDRVISHLEADLGIRTDGKRERRRHRVRETAVPDVEPSSRRRTGLTEEQERRRHINSVVSDIRGETRTTFGVERERIQDIKASKLEQIGQLRMTLEEEGIDCSGVSNPTPESQMKEIDAVLNILRLKNDRNRYSSLAEEVMLGGAELIESVFDGTRAVPIVGWRPDFTGYHNTLNSKLHRMRFETSQVVGNIIEKYNIGPTSRIILEILPSFFLYPRQQRAQRGKPGLSSDPHVADARGAINAIRDADARKTLEDASRV